MATEERGYSIRGRVQGVGFRWWTRKTAESLDLEGSVKNLSDGTVEVHVRGEPERLDELEERFRSGPSSARVEGVSRASSSLPIPDGHFRIVR